MMASRKVIFSLATLAIAAGATVALWHRPQQPPHRTPASAEIKSAGVRDTSQPSAPENQPAATQALSPDRLPATNQALLAFLESSSPLLSVTGVQAALDYLRNPVPAESADNPAAEYFNNVIALLLAQPDLPLEFPAVLLRTVNDSGRPLLLRDYAMQHLYHVWKRERNPVTKQDLESCLKHTMEDVNSPLQAVALLTISRFTDLGPVTRGPGGEKLIPVGGSQPRSAEFLSKPLSFTSADIVNAALHLTVDASASNNARSCAFNVLLRLGANQAIYPARTALRDPATPEDVRCAALASLGAFGDVTTDRPLLDSIPQKPQLVRAAADAALRRLLKPQPGH